MQNNCNKTFNEKNCWISDEVLLKVLLLPLDYFQLSIMLIERFFCGFSYFVLHAVKKLILSFCIKIYQGSSCNSLNCKRLFIQFLLVQIFKDFNGLIYLCQLCVDPTKQQTSNINHEYPPLKIHQNTGKYGSKKTRILAYLAH